MNLGIKLIHPGARMPTYATSGAAAVVALVILAIDGRIK